MLFNHHSLRCALLFKCKDFLAKQSVRDLGKISVVPFLPLFVELYLTLTEVCIPYTQIWVTFHQQVGSQTSFMQFIFHSHNILHFFILVCIPLFSLEHVLMPLLLTLVVPPILPKYSLTVIPLLPHHQQCLVLLNSVAAASPKLHLPSASPKQQPLPRISAACF